MTDINLEQLDTLEQDKQITPEKNVNARDFRSKRGPTRFIISTENHSILKKELSQNESVDVLLTIRASAFKSQPLDGNIK